MEFRTLWGVSRDISGALGYITVIIIQLFVGFTAVSMNLGGICTCCLGWGTGTTHLVTRSEKVYLASIQTLAVRRKNGTAIRLILAWRDGRGEASVGPKKRAFCRHRDRNLESRHFLTQCYENRQQFAQLGESELRCRSIFDVIILVMSFKGRPLHSERLDPQS